MSSVQETASRFGLSDGEWEQAKRELREAIVAAARERRITHYGEIAPAVTVIHVEAFSSIMNRLLGEIMREEYEAGRPALTAIVTRQDGDQEPGPGFYALARSLGIPFDKPYVYWSSQVQQVFDLYGRSRRSRSGR